MAAPVTRLQERRQVIDIFWSDLATVGRHVFRSTKNSRCNLVAIQRNVVGATTGPVAHGAVIFYNKGCEFCHQGPGVGRHRGPD